MLRIQVSFDVALSRWMRGSRRFGRTYCFIFKVKAVCLDCLAFECQYITAPLNKMLVSLHDINWNCILFYCYVVVVGGGGGGVLVVVVVVVVVE
jgi:hypothetical protein